MTPIKRGISFTAEPLGKTGEYGRLRCIVTWNHQRARISLRLPLTMRNWDKITQRARARTYHGFTKVPATYVNCEIERVNDRLQEAFADFEARDKIPRPWEVATVVEKMYEGGDIGERGFFDLYDEYIQENLDNGNWTDSSLRKMKTIKRHLLSLDPDLTFDKLGDGGVRLMIKHFSTVPDKSKATGLANSTILKDIGIIKAFVRWAVAKGHCPSDNALLKDRPRLKVTPKPVIFLNWEELMQVYRWDFSRHRSYDQVRDVFCFCCFTSLRYSDVRNLRKGNIRKNDFTLTTVKTNDTLTIQLNQYSKAILDKYAGSSYPGDAALPVISNQRMNDYLKEIGRICGIDAPISLTKYKGSKRLDVVKPKWELMTTHVGRRTFVCNALALGISPEVVMQWTGHSDYRAMKPYIAIADKTKRQAMTAFDTVGQKVGQPSAESAKIR